MITQIQIEDNCENGVDRSVYVCSILKKLIKTIEGYGFMPTNYQIQDDIYETVGELTVFCSRVKSFPYPRKV